MSDAAMKFEQAVSEETVDNGFYSPVPLTLIKGREENGEWIIYLEASNERKDSQDESVAMSALQEQRDLFLRKGVISWDHLHKIERDTNYVIGEPLDVRFTPENTTLVKAKLYKHNKYAQGVWANLQSGSTRYGSSIGGYTLKKAGNKVTKVYWNEVAITHEPVNSTTHGKVSVVPFQQFMKALTAGGGVNPAEFGSGRSLQPESLDRKLTDLTHGQVDERALYSLVRDVRHKIQKGELTDVNEFVAFVKSKGLVKDSEVVNLAKAVLKYVKEPAVSRV